MFINSGFSIRQKSSSFSIIFDKSKFESVEMEWRFKKLILTNNAIKLMDLYGFVLKEVLLHISLQLPMNLYESLINSKY